MTFEEIYFEHQKMVYNLSLQYVQNIEDAEEITQDVFVKVYDHLSSFQNKSSLKTWIYRITINKSLDFIKAQKAQKRNLFSQIFSLSDATLKQEPVNFNHPGIELEQREGYKIIFDAINKLSDNQKTAIILLKIENKTQAETAEIMNIKVKALDSLFQRAKKNLETILNKKG